MTEPILHPQTRESIQRFVDKPSHAVLLVAPAGAGKATVARYIAAQLLRVAPEKLTSHAQFKVLAPQEGRAISIESVREVTHFLALRTTVKAGVARIVLIEDAHRLTIQAQNALLKTIEEPPADTVLILTAPSEQSILPTIRSRVQALSLLAPDTSALKDYFKAAAFSDAAIAKAVLMSGGLPGLCCALLSDDTSHPLVAAAARARDLLQQSAFERLAAVDDLVKQKQEWLDTLSMLERMAHISLQNRQASPAVVRRWHTVLKASHTAYAQTSSSAQVKLVALNFMLSI